MSCVNTFRLLYFLNKSKTNQDGAPILMRITINGEQVALNTKRRIPIDQWDTKSGLPNPKNHALQELSMYLDAFKNKVYRTITELTHESEMITASMVRDRLKGNDKEKQINFLEQWDNHNEKVRESINKGYSKALWRKHCRARTIFTNFLWSKYKLKEIPIKKLKFQIIDEFQHYMRASLGYEHNTAVRTLKFMKKITNAAIKNDWIQRCPFEGISLKMKQVDRPYLTDEELARLVGKEFSMQRLAFVKDMFVFACFTGLAYIDVKQLKRSDLEQSPDGLWWIKIRRQKTNVKSQIPLLETAKEIIDKYADLNKMRGEELLLPVLSNQKLNAYLKEVADMCEINKCLTFHVARHTFATTVTLQNGVSIESVSRMLGHSNIRTTQHYARIVDKKIAQDMEAMALRTNQKLARKVG